MLVDLVCQEKFERIILCCQEKFMMTPKVRRSLHEKFLFSLNNDLTKYICGHCSDKEWLRVTHFN
jgi:hypothetical protein